MMQPPPADLLTLTGVTYRYSTENVLVDVDLVVGAGDFVGIVGPSGSGKTTLLRVIAGSVRPDTGAMRRRDALRVAYVPQTDRIDWSFPITVQQCVLMARGTNRWLPWPTRHERAAVDEMLDRLSIGGLAGRHIRELSSGQQQRVFIARALMSEPDLMLMDEPTSGVDVKVRHEVLHLLGELNAAGLSIVLTTHDLNGIAAHLPRIVCVNRSVIGEGTPRQVLTSAVLERTYGASMDVLEHGGMPLVVERPRHAHPDGEYQPHTTTDAPGATR